MSLKNSRNWCTTLYLYAYMTLSYGFEAPAQRGYAAYKSARI